ncbi:MAG: 50S ribosomal protein L23 [Puniceicoccales bacterium]|jgi:large subunit ribosomal protein L23|nr:50S ribosomal protein L23 [Puniceicoccales bacterium]
MEKNGSILKQYRLTEKSSTLSTEMNQYIFEVATDATKAQISRSIFGEFGVKPLRVNVLRQQGKLKRSRISKKETTLVRKPEMKKAFVSLRKGDKIEIL